MINCHQKEYGKNVYICRPEGRPVLHNTIYQLCFNTNFLKNASYRGCMIMKSLMWAPLTFLAITPYHSLSPVSTAQSRHLLNWCLEQALTATVQGWPRLESSLYLLQPWPSRSEPRSPGSVLTHPGVSEVKNSQNPYHMIVAIKWEWRQRIWLEITINNNTQL